MLHKLFLAFIFITLNLCSFAQGAMKTKKWRATERDSMEKGQLLFDEENYGIALPIFEQILKNHPNELYLKYIYGLCSLYRSDKHEESLNLLTEVYKENKKTSEIEIDLARACHLNYKFDEALKLIDIYKSKTKVIPPKRKKEIELLVDYCNNGKELVANPKSATITNIGPPVNTEAMEYVPVISSDETVMIYTYRGNKSVGGLQNAYNQPDPYGIYYEDVYITYKDSTGNFEEPKDIGTTINTASNDAAVALSPDGQKLFIFKDDGTNGGDLYMSILTGKDWSMPERLRGDINSPAWEGSCSLSSDGKTLYFSSERPGGYGGRDIYYSNLQEDGSWGSAINMGDKINTPYDDDAPFIHPDNRILLYSSKGKNSMGGYDIFRTIFNAENRSWEDPVNIGYPINSPDDDIYYVLSADGKTGYYSSGKTGGEGLQDIYMISPGLEGVDAFVAMVKGTVTLNGEPLEAAIDVELENVGMAHTQLKANALTGKYLATLPDGYLYKLIFKHEGYPDQERTVDLTAITGYTEKIIDVDFGKPTADTASVAKIEGTKTETVPEAYKPVIEYTPPAENKLANITLDGLTFRVQIAAYKIPDNYNYTRLKGLGNVEKIELEGIARFTIGGDFKTMAEASKHCEKVRKAGQADAFVTAIYKGKRVYLEDLVKQGIIKQD